MRKRQVNLSLMIRGVDETAFFEFIPLSRVWVDSSAGTGIIPANFFLKNIKSLVTRA